MPWCRDCDRFYNPNSVRSDGTCPTCGLRLGEPEKLRKFSDEPAPWHFKILVAAVSVYLSFRLYQGVLWVTKSL